MTREDFDKQQLDIIGKRDALQNEILELNTQLEVLRKKYIDEYPDLIRYGTKVHITTQCRNWDEVTYIEEIDAFVGDNRILTKFDWDYSHIYEDRDIFTKLFKVKKDGTRSERVARLNGKVIDIQILD